MTRKRLLAVVSLIGLVVSTTATAGTVYGPAQDMRETVSNPTGSAYAIIIHTGPWTIGNYTFTDRIEIKLPFGTSNLRTLGIGYVHVGADAAQPELSRVTTIYGLDAAPPGSVVLSMTGLNASVPEYTIEGGATGETIYGNDGLAYPSYEKLFVADIVGTLLGLGITDTSPFPSGTSSGSYYLFNTWVPTAKLEAVPEIDPAGLSGVAALVAGAIGLLERRRRR